MDTMVKDIRPGMKMFNVTVIVLEVGNPIIVKEREVRTLKVADATACINLSLWDDPGRYLIPGDIIRITKGHANVFRNCLTLYAGKGSDLDKLGDFCMVFNEQTNMSEPNLPFEGGPSLIQAINNGGPGGLGAPQTNNNGGKVTGTVAVGQRSQPVKPPSQQRPVQEQTSKGQTKNNNKSSRGSLKGIVRSDRR